MDKSMNYDKNENYFHWMQNHGYIQASATHECREFLRLLQCIHAKDGEFLFEAGERGDRIFVVRQGNVQVGDLKQKRRWMDMGPFGCVDMDEEKRFPVWNERTTVHEGECLGLRSFLTGGPHSKSAMAVGDVELLGLSIHQYRYLARHHPDMCHCFSDGLRRSWQARKGVTGVR